MASGSWHHRYLTKFWVKMTSLRVAMIIFFPSCHALPASAASPWWWVWRPQADAQVGAPAEQKGCQGPPAVVDDGSVAADVLPTGGQKVFDNEHSIYNYWHLPLPLWKNLSILMLSMSEVAAEVLSPGDQKSVNHNQPIYYYRHLPVSLWNFVSTLIEQSFAPRILSG